MISLCYISRSCIGGDIGTLIDIWDTSQTYNRKRQVTGALYCDTTSFLQVLEGPEPGVMRTLRAICADERHSDIHMLCGRRIVQRQFGDWDMKIVNAMSDEIMPQRFNRDRIIDGGQRYLDARFAEMLDY